MDWERWLDARGSSYWAEEERNSSLPTADFIREFMRMARKPGVPLPLPPAGPMPDWMAKRPAGLRAFMAAFKNLDHARLRQFPRPVYIAYGDQSAVVEDIKAKRLAAIFPDCTLGVYQGTHHFAPRPR